MGLPFSKSTYSFQLCQRYQQPVVSYYDRIAFYSIQVVEEEFG